MKRSKKAVQAEDSGIHLNEICYCERCKVKCRVGAVEPSKAKMLCRSTKPKGYCNNCAVTEFLANSYPPNMIIEESQHGAAILLFPQIQEQFAQIMAVAGSDMKPEEINWQTIVDNWDLPLKVKKSNTNCHLPGDSVKRRLAQKDFREESLFSTLTKAVESGTGRPTLHTALSFIPEEEENDGGYIC